MTIPEQRRELRRIGEQLIKVADNEPYFDWKYAKALRDELGEALITEAQKQKRQRLLERRRQRRIRKNSDAWSPRERAIVGGDPSL